MKTIEITECKLCGAEYYSGQRSLTLEPDDTVEFVTKRVARCGPCKQREDRTIANRGKKVRRQ